MPNKIYMALEAYETLLQKKPDYVRGYIHAGMLCIQLGIIGRGIEYLRAALAYAPTLRERTYIESQIRDQARVLHRRHCRADDALLAGTRGVAP